MNPQPPQVDDRCGFSVSSDLLEHCRHRVPSEDPDPIRIVPARIAVVGVFLLGVIRGRTKFDQLKRCIPFNCDFLKPPQGVGLGNLRFKYPLESSYPASCPTQLLLEFFQASPRKVPALSFSIIPFSVERVFANRLRSCRYPKIIRVPSPSIPCHYEPRQERFLDF